MKKLVLASVLLLFLFSSNSHAGDVWFAGDFTGGCADCLDNVYQDPNGHAIALGDAAIVVVADVFYFYSLVDTGNTENSPLVIDPDDANVDADYRWELTKSGETRVRSVTLNEPHNLVTTDVPLLPIETEWAPNGITILDCGIKTDNSSTYSVTFENWDDPAGTTQETIEVVATSASYEAEDDGTLSAYADVDAGYIVYAALPATAGTSMLVLWFTYIVNGS